MSDYRKQIGVLVDAFVNDVAELARTSLTAALKPAQVLGVVHVGGTATDEHMLAVKRGMSLNEMSAKVEKATKKQLKAATKKLTKKVRKSTAKAVAKTVKKIENVVDKVARARRLDVKKLYRLREKLNLGKALTAEQQAWMTRYESKLTKPVANAA